MIRANMGVGAECVRYLVFSTNLLFMLFGLSLVVAGTVVQLMYKDVVAFVPHEVISLPIVAIIIGAVIFTVSLFAHCGASRKSICMLRTFMLLLGLLFALQIAAGVAAYYFHSDIERGIETRMRESMELYGEDGGHPAVTVAWDVVQEGLDCCGVDSYHDWDPYLLRNHGYPASCNNPVKLPFDKPPRGCLKAFAEGIRSQIVILAGVVLGIALVQVVALIFASCVVRSIRKERKREDREPLVR